MVEYVDTAFDGAVSIGSHREVCFAVGVEISGSQGVAEVVIIVFAGDDG